MQAQFPADVQAEVLGSHSGFSDMSQMSQADLLAILGTDGSQISQGINGMQQAAYGSVRNQRPKSSKLCRHWQQYRCSHGDDCQFSHDCEGGPGGAPGPFPRAPIVQKTATPGFIQAQAQAQAEAQARAQAQLAAEQSALEQHREYPQLPVSDGFREGLEDQVEAAVALLQNPIVQRMMASKAVASGGTVDPTICQAFQMGVCYEGDRCKYSHGGAANSASVGPSRSARYVPY